MMFAGHYLKFNFAKSNYSLSKIKNFCSNFLHFAQNLTHIFYMKALQITNEFCKVLILYYNKDVNQILL